MWAELMIVVVKFDTIESIIVWFIDINQSQELAIGYFGFDRSNLKTIPNYIFWGPIEE